MHTRTMGGRRKTDGSYRDEAISTSRLRVSRPRSRRRWDLAGGPGGEPATRRVGSDAGPGRNACSLTRVGVRRQPSRPACVRHWPSGIEPYNSIGASLSSHLFREGVCVGGGQSWRSNEPKARALPWLCPCNPRATSAGSPATPQIQRSRSRRPVNAIDRFSSIHVPSCKSS